jgi:hypothetical protein
MREVSVLVKENLGGEDAKSRQSISKHHPQLTDPRDPLFMIPFIKDAQEAKKRLDDFDQRYHEKRVSGIRKFWVVF